MEGRKIQFGRIAGAGLAMKLLSTPAFAQDITGDRVRAALERTDMRIELAQSLVAGSNNAEARVEVDAAVSLQGQARDAFSQALLAIGDAQTRLLRRAIDLTLRARAHADRARALGGKVGQIYA